MSQTLETKTHYRADIQGLRGIAVLLVVVYHTGLALPGGFVGVDMFFVISGFVITQVLIREYEETGRIKLGHFYARRARRLIPALSIVTIFTLLISLVAMSPFGEQQQIIKTAIGPDKSVSRRVGGLTQINHHRCDGMHHIVVPWSACE